jgi:hypothetical protein
MAATTVQVPSGVPFPLGKTASKPWREQALARIAEQRFVLAWMRSKGTVVDPVVAQTLEDHWTAAASAAQGRSRWGALVERVTSHLDAVDADLLRLGPDSYVLGQLPGLIARMKLCLPDDDLRRKRIEAIADNQGCATVSECERDMIVAAQHAVGAESRRQVTRLRSFKSVILVTALVLALGAIGLAVFGFLAPEKLPLCFSPDGNIVCPTSTHAITTQQSQGASSGQPSTLGQAEIDPQMREWASGWDIALVELVGLLAAAIAAAAALRKIRGTSTPFSLPVALALLKLPTGALTAVLGIVLMRGEFIPGLSALDSSAQIISWAVLLGYSQQLLTRFVDQRAQTVLDNFGRTRTEQQRANATIAPAPAVT